MIHEKCETTPAAVSQRRPQSLLLPLGWSSSEVLLLPSIFYFDDRLAMSLPSLTNKSMYEQSEGSYSENGEEKFNFQTPARTMSPTKAHQTDMFT